MATIDGWCPFAVRLPSANYTPGSRGCRAVVIHIVQGTYESAVSWLRNSQSQASAHFVIAKDGRVAQLVSIKDTAWGNGLGWSNGQWTNPQQHPVHPGWADLQAGLNPNLYTISIEHEGTFQEPWTSAMYEANNRLLQWIAQETGISYAPGRTLIGHKDIDPVDRPNCPGPAVDFARMAADANSAGGVTTTFAPVSEATPLLGSGAGPRERAVAYVQARLKPGSEYTSDVGTIFGYYWTYAPGVGVDPFIAAAQCVFETDSLNSAWAARPHRNPAGLGVRQEGGLSFESWDVAVQAHIGQLLAFALRDDQASEAQRRMIQANPRLGQIDPALRGSVKTLADLSGRWTADPDYAGGLAARANAILEIGPSATLGGGEDEQLVEPIQPADAPVPVSDAHLPD